MPDPGKSAIDPAVLDAVRGASDLTDRHSDRFRAARRRLHVDHQLGPVTTDGGGWNRASTASCRCGWPFTSGPADTSLYSQHELHLDAMAYAVIESPEARCLTGPGQPAKQPHALAWAHGLRPLRTKVDWFQVAYNVVAAIFMVFLAAKVTFGMHKLTGITFTLEQVLGAVAVLFMVVCVKDAVWEVFQPDRQERQRRAEITEQAQEIETLEASLEKADADGEAASDERDDMADALSDVLRADTLDQAKGHAATALGHHPSHRPAITVLLDENDPDPAATTAMLTEIGQSGAVARQLGRDRYEGIGVVPQRESETVQ